MQKNITTGIQLTNLDKKRKILKQLLRKFQVTVPEEDIAIIGVSGHYPMAETLDEFWENLSGGKSCISEIPQDRWDWKAFYDQDPNARQKIYNRWGGFIKDADKFDPRFFGISPLEAQAMDPQERLFLQTTYEAIEDAGYTKKNLSRQNKIGVFVGAMNSDYEFLGGETWSRGKFTGANSSYWSFANRVSYYLNLQGPSLAIDTACSSSLTAIHLACESIKRGECEAAIAGGVNLILHPIHYIRLSDMNMLARDHRCKSFSEGADGLIDGEGVGAIFLKPLSKAIEDNDHVYAVIKASAINSSGRTTGYRSPNPNAHASLIETALQKGAIDARTISYIEAHGTGTAMGDAIEVRGLTNAFEKYTSDKQFCVLGTIKPNIGHLESAAGIAALTKVLLQLKHKQIAPFIQSGNLNPDIDFNNSPFHFQNELSEWKRKVGTGENEKTQPLRAGISSFGAGGANAHVILEEWNSEMQNYSSHAGPCLVVLSAQNEERLSDYAQKLIRFLKRMLRSSSPVIPTLADIAYTLQVGREAMQSRLAVVVSDIAELIERLEQFQLADGHAINLYRGNTGQTKGRPDKAQIENGIQNKDLEKIAGLWVTGADIPWTRLYESLEIQQPRRVPLPTYPFAKERYWTDVSVQPLIDLEQSVNGSLVPVAEKLLAEEKPASPKPIKQENKNGHFNAEFHNDILKIISEILDVSEHDIDLDSHISEYGFDSIAVTGFTNKLNDQYNLEIKPTLFFEHSTIGSLVEHLKKVHHETFTSYYSTEKPAAEQIVPKIDVIAEELVSPNSYKNDETASVNATPSFLNDTVYFSNPSPLNQSDVLDTKTSAEIDKTEMYPSIAIIGMSGKMPQSDNLDEFWQNLEQRKDLISEIPTDRWNWKDIYGDPKTERGKTNIKWAGFINDIDKFDAAFFNISPREAELMDPQQRIFLETVWKTIEDAGYSPSDLSGTRTGIFVGVGSNDYQHVLSECDVDIEAYTLTGLSHAIFANRISYLLNLHGPSQPVDTGCSSSLVAIYHAAESIWRGECEMAIAGGVNAILSPALILSLSKAGMLSEDGRCKTFDRLANGYARGEGVGAIMLKPLSKALADKDHIHAVLKGVAVNHGGRAKSLTAPNPLAQAQVVMDALRKAKVEPETVTYIEAHGTATNLGDPIEINGLKKAFAELSSQSNPSSLNEPYCGLSSVKTNIGHLETAAGIAGVIKVILAMQHQKLPGTVHFNELNQNIELSASPFYIVKDTKPWERLCDSNHKFIPRRAGVSSFGFGGVNAHVVLEEFEAPTTESLLSRPEIFVLSAKNEVRLKAYAQSMVEFLDKQESVGISKKNLNLTNIAFTLQTGREPLEERLAMIVTSIGELRHKLVAYCEGKENLKDCFTGNLKANRGNLQLLFDGKTGEEVMKLILSTKDYKKLALLWVSGAKINWHDLHTDKSTRRISLPTYPFEKVSHWISSSKKNIKPKSVSSPANTQEQIPAHKANFSLKDNTQQLKELFAEKLKMDVHLVNEDATFYDLGIESILLMEILQSLTKAFNLKVNLTEVQDFDTIKKWAQYIDANSKEAWPTNHNGKIHHTGKKISSTDNAKYESLFLNKYQYAFKGYSDQVNISFLHSSTGQKIEALVYGEGEPLLLLPPIDGIATCWLYQFKELAEQFRLIVLHYPGYGRSEFNSDYANFEAIADESIRALSLLGITEKVHLAGWSMGGMIAQVIATKHSQRVKTLSLVNTTSFLDEEATIENIYTLATKVRDDFRKNMPKPMQKDNDQLLECIKACYFNEISLHYHLQVLDFDYRAKLSNVNVPTLIISGAKDKLTPPENGAFIHQQIKNSEYQVFKNGGHYIPLQNSRYFNKALRDFIEASQKEEVKSISEEVEVS